VDGPLGVYGHALVLAPALLEVDPDRASNVPVMEEAQEREDENHVDSDREEERER
jgi:hypothetical protein